MTWLYLPPACLGSQSAAADLSVASPELSDESAARLASFVLSRSKPMPLRSWQRAWRSKPWIRRLYGVTCEHSTLDHGVERWISSLRDTPVSPSLSLASDLDQTILATSGLTSLASYANPSLPYASSRTSPVTCLPEDAKSSESFKAWALMLRRHCGLRRKLAPRTDANGSSSLLPTPSASSYGSNRGGAAGRLGPDGPGLETMARKGLWPTPLVADSKSGGCGQAREGGPSLTQAVKERSIWPTPTVKGNHNKLGLSPRSGDGLATAVGGPLNPAWVEWLMGWPIGWSDCGSSVTASSRNKQKRQSKSALAHSELVGEP